ncbi:MAG TPA: metalloprotease TldD [Oculatellaceae cyanobacterium]
MRYDANAEATLHRLFGLSRSQVERVITAALGKRRKEGAFGEVYFQAGSSQTLIWDLERLTTTRWEVTSGASVRAVLGDKFGFAYTNDPTAPNLVKAAKRANAIMEYGQESGSQPIEGENRNHNLYRIDNSPIAVSLKDKIALLKECDAAARAVDPRIENVRVSLQIEDTTIVIAPSIGDIIVDVRPLIRLDVSCIAADGTRRENGHVGGGGRHEFDYFQRNELWRQMAVDAAKQAIASLSAEPGPVGEMTVVLGNGWPGILLHEAVGHGLEGDFNRKGTSAFSSMMGEMVASPLCTVIDKGTMPGRRGSLDVDDEGNPTQDTVLIENGRLVGYMQDRMNASLMKSKLTGNGRRESYKYAPMPRMTNTMLVGGSSTHEEIIASVDRGVYAEQFGGGQVDITSGKFTFSATTAYLIENGKLTKPIKGATLIGNGPEAMRRISMVGNNMAMDLGIGTCGKNGQGVPVGVGMPTVRIDGITVGGIS